MQQLGIITQARMTSTRLPGKVLMHAGGRPLLAYHLDRLKQSGYPVLLATTTNPTDDVLVAFAIENDIPYSRGSEDDVLGRYYAAALQAGWAHVVRVTSDCPLIDGALIAKGISEYMALKTDWAYMANTLERSYPRGFDFEIFSVAALALAHAEARAEREREHVTPYLREGNIRNMQLHNIRHETDSSHYRLTVDEPDDFRLLQALIENYGAAKLSCDEIIRVLDANPALATINAHVEQKKA